MTSEPGLNDLFHDLTNIEIMKQKTAAETVPPVTCLHRSYHRIGSSDFGESPMSYSFKALLLDISLVIFIMNTIRLFLKPLKQARVVAEIIGGVMIGPSVLGRSYIFRTHIFPENVAFLMRNIGVIGFMFYLFVSWVRMDISLVKKAGRKHLYIALTGVSVPIISAVVVALILRKDMDKDLAKVASIGGVSAGLGITNFPNLYIILKELNLLSSDIGRMALSTSIVGDAIGVNAIIAFEAAYQGEHAASNILWYLISFFVVAAFVAFVLRRLMVGIANSTGEGQPIDQNYVVGILLGVFVIAFVTDMLGLAIANGPLWLGLIIPDGPPLGSTMLDKSEMITMEFLMPFAYALVGLYVDFSSMAAIPWTELKPLFFITLAAFLTKLLSTLIMSIVCKMPWRDGLVLSLILSLRGQTELILYVHWIDKLIIKQPGFTLLIIMTTVWNMMLTPLISILHDPARPYMVNKRRTIQHTPLSTELRIVICILDKQNLPGIISILEVSNPTISSPFQIYALHMLELIGRASPILIDHQQEEQPLHKYQCSEIVNVLKFYEEMRDELIKIQIFTVVTPLQTMYQDICELALEFKSTLIILPFHIEDLSEIAGSEILNGATKIVNSHVLSHAPCSVGVLVDKGNLQNPVIGPSTHLSKYFVMLFLGGPDAREALAYADRMVGNIDVSLTVVRFLAHNYEGDDEIERKLDDGVVTSFWVKYEGNNRVAYKEVVVSNGEETVAAINDIGEDGCCDLWIVGRKHGINPTLIQGLSSWSENQELGVIGDYVSSPDFKNTASVLVIQQQILRG